jgi:hypothetical protein
MPGGSGVANMGSVRVVHSVWGRHVGDQRFRGREAPDGDIDTWAITPHFRGCGRGIFEPVLNQRSAADLIRAVNLSFRACSGFFQKAGPREQVPFILNGKGGVTNPEKWPVLRSITMSALPPLATGSDQLIWVSVMVAG